MGVNGLTPFLRKAYPAVLQKLPERFKALSGKRLIIDGTLITQRFHFVQEKHPYQHVVSWYRLARELEEHNISAICVFDGKERHNAKARETERRREVRRLTVARAAIEQDRFARLNKMKEAVERYQKLDATDRQKVATLLLSDASFGDSDSTTLLQEGALLLRDKNAPPPVLSPASPHFETEKTALPSTAQKKINIADIVTPQDVALQMKSLFLGFKANVAKMVTISMDSADAPLATPLASPGEDDKIEKIMTKSQYELTVDESKFWRDCTSALVVAASSNAADQSSPTSLFGPDLAQQNRLFTLAFRSFSMASMYERRTNGPTQGTYTQSREILDAMGIRCIVVDGAYEAEAVASSMVLAGEGDYVVSEDTDVLVFEAPLIRNFTGREPFLKVSGAEVRAAMNLSRDAYIDFILLMGTDFSQRITNVGPIRALKFVKELGSIENIIESIAGDPKYSLKLPKSAYLAQVDIARSVFKALPPVPPKSTLNPVKKDDNRVEEILRKYGVPMAEIYPEWYADARYDDALSGNFFSDNPMAI